EGCAIGMIEAASPVAYYSILNSLSHICCALPCGCEKGTMIMGSGCGGTFYSGSMVVVNAIVHLFNYHVMTKKDWTMDQLIDWVRSVEPPDPEEDAPKVNEEKPVADKEYEEVPACK